MVIRMVARTGDTVTGLLCAYSKEAVADGDTVRFCDGCGWPTIEARAESPETNNVALAGYQCANCRADLRVEGDPGYVGPGEMPQAPAPGPPLPPPPPPPVGLPGQVVGPGAPVPGQVVWGPPPGAPTPPPAAPVTPPVAPAGAFAGLRLSGPMTLGDALDRTFRIYRACFKSLMAGSALLHVAVGIPGIAFSVALAVAMPNLMQMDIRMLFDPQYYARAQSDPFWQYHVESTPMLILAGVLGVISLAIFLGVCGWSYAAQTCAALASFQDKPLSPREALAQGRPFHWSFLGMLVLAWMIIGAAAMCSCGIGAIFVGPLFALCMPAIIVERIGAVQSLGRSYEIVKREYWRLVGWCLVLYLIYLAIQYGLGMLANLLGMLSATVIGNAGACGIQNTLGQALSLVLTPIPIVGTVVFYLDARVRQEAIDVMGGPPMPQAPAAPAALPGSPSG